jgi:hypothetical protein
MLVGITINAGAIMQKLVTATLSAFLLLAAGAQAQTKNCEVPPFHTADNQTVEGRMIVKAGKRCSVRMAVSLGGVSDPEVLKQPRSGTAAVGSYDIIYTPKKGFVGADEFTYARRNIDRYGNKSLRTVNMKVQVQP